MLFQAPLPAKPWIGILDAAEHRPVCPQFDMTAIQIVDGSEDCLFLNVYTKSLQPSSKIPVMVYIHGGAFLSGSGNSNTYGPEYFFQHDVILVTLNYRLEALGFLCLDTPEVPGNAGMKDQVIALRWVKENISNFGGDPDNITIFGESAGASAITYHMLSPMSKGLFNRAIAQSGVCLSYWSMAHKPVERAFRAAKVLGKDTNNPNELLEYLRSVPAVDLARISMKTRTNDEKFRGLPIYFTPTVEKKFQGLEQFLTEDPVDLILAGKVNKVPLLIGYNSAEGILIVNDHAKKAHILNKDPSHLVPRDIATKVSANKLKDFGHRIKNFYTGNKEFSDENAQANVDLYTDINFSYQAHRFSHFYQSLAPTYMYVFDYSTELNILKELLNLGAVKGACHAEDLFYLFHNHITHNEYEEHENIRKIVWQVTKFWVDFARTG